MPKGIEKGLEKRFVKPQVLTYHCEFQKRSHKSPS